MEVEAIIEGRHASDHGTGPIRNKNMTLVAYCHKNDVVLRHDDGANLAFWLQTTITREQLEEMLKEMDHAEE